MMNAIERLTASLADRYSIERELGAGGMATVYLARDIKHSRNVALKLLKPDLAAVIGTERFFSEIQVTANLQHPHLLPLFDSGSADGLLFYVMPYVEGETLRARLDRERQLPIADTLHIAKAVASALDYAHRHGVIHRDLKPENILLHEREPLVMDFGIALAVSNAGGARVTQTGLSLGTPQYMSPEQATGDRVIDARTDIYSLGAVVYEMLTGDPPHAGTTVQAVIARVLTDAPRSIRASRDTVPEHVELAVMKALAKLPADRFESAAAFADALEGGAHALVPAATRALAPTQPMSLAHSVRASFAPRALAIGGVAAAAAVVLGAFASRALQDDEPLREARFVMDVPDSLRLSSTMEYQQLALSPDGSRVVQYYGSTRPLYVRRLDQLGFDAVPGSDSAITVSFSPDSRHLLFFARGVGSLSVTSDLRVMRIPVEGGAAVKIADSAFARGQASWSDRNEVIFRRGSRLMLVSANGGAARPLAEPDTTRGQAALGWPQFLPGGTKALITIERRGGAPADSSYIGVVSVTDGAVADLGIRGFTPRYAQGHLLYVDHAGQLFAVRFDAARGRVAGEPRVLSDNVRLSTTGTDLSVAADGTILFTDGGPATSVAREAPAFTLVRVDQAGRETVLDIPPRYYRDFRISPDGERIALTVNESGATASPTDIYLYTLSTGQTRRFTRNGTSRQPVWTRDGKRIVYAVDDPSKSPAVRYVAEPWDQSSPPEPFPGADGAEYLELGPAGGYLAQVRTDSSNSSNDTQIFIAPVDSAGSLRPFASTGMRERWVRISPDGKWLAYHAHEIRTGGSSEGLGGRSGPGGAGFAMGSQRLSAAYLYLSPVPGPGERLQVSKAFGDTPMWSKDSKTLYFIDRPDVGLTNATLSAAEIGLVAGRIVARTRSLFAMNAMSRNLAGSPSPASTGVADIAPGGDFYFLRFLPPAGSGNSAVRLPSPRAIVIVHGLSTASANTPPASR